jgi:multiple antibiotic resistance protein
MSPPGRATAGRPPGTLARLSLWTRRGIVTIIHQPRLPAGAVRDTRRAGAGLPAGTCQVKHAPRARRAPHRLVQLAVACGILSAAGVAAAAGASVGAPPAQPFALAQVFTLLFLMLGPFKIVGPFAKLTQDAEPAYVRRLALLASAFSAAALLVAALVGERVLGNFGIPLPMLALAGGIILFLNALQVTLQQFALPAQEQKPAAAQVTQSISRLALAPLAFPTIVTPYGIAALVVFLALAPDPMSRLKVGGVVLAIMLLNLAVMLLTRHIVRILLVVLTILGAVLGVVQVALGLQIMFKALTTLGVL